MNDLAIVKSQNFGYVQCDIYQNANNDIFMTINQLAEALEYASKKGVEHILERNNYLKDVEFSTTHKLGVVEGEREVTREMRLFTEDGICEVAMLSSQPKAQEFRSFIRKVLKALRSGDIVAKQTPQTYIQALKAYVAELERNETLQLENKIVTQQFLEVKPKADYCDTILQSDKTVTVTTIAKDYGMSGIAFNKLLSGLNVQYKFKKSDSWLLYANIQDKGYTHSKTHTYKNSVSETAIKLNTEWTQKGRLYLYNLLKTNNVLPMIEQ